MIRLESISLTSPEEIQQLANNHAISVNLRDVFPYPFTLEDAVELLLASEKGYMGHVFGIYDDKTFVGCCSLTPQYDVYRFNAEIGYWIGEPYWGRGYATEAIKQLIDFAFTELRTKELGYSSLIKFLVCFEGIKLSTLCWSVKSYARHVENSTADKPSSSY